MTNRELVSHLAGVGFERLLRDGPPRPPHDPETAALLDEATARFNDLRRPLEALSVHLGIPSVWG